MGVYPLLGAIIFQMCAATSVVIGRVAVETDRTHANEIMVNAQIFDPPAHL